MRGRSLSPAVFHRRSRSQSVAALGLDDILFPKSYEDEWELADARNTDLERARFFMIRFGNTSKDPMIQSELLSIASNQLHRTVPALAFAVQTRIFANRHATFAATPLLQCMRFLLIKARVSEVMFSDRTKVVLDFFFDPAMARNLDPLPKDTVVYRYPAAHLKIAIIGGGPTALSSAISLAEKGAGKVEVHMYERRWVEKSGPHGIYIDYPPTAKRRDQVVTLQNSVTTLMSAATQEALFEGRPEHVWPGSANLQIRKVEDRLLKRCQAAEFRGLIHLHPEGIERATLSKVGDFHVLLGADGAASWLRKSYFEGYEKERGRSYALGLAFDRPEGLPWSQPLNMFLTLGQTRYLLNASDFDGRGYLNMQLTEEEWHKMLSVDGQPVTFGNPGCLRIGGKVPQGFKESQVFAPSEDRESLLWKSIEDGLKLFGFKESEVINVVRIPIVVQAVREGVHYLPPQDAAAINRPHALVAVAGDAAMTVHFWPGRGLNSGIKSGIALGDEIVHALNNGQFVGLPLGAMKEYNDFILKLQGREHDKRSIPILNQSGTPETLAWLLGKAYTVPDNVAIEWLVGAMLQIADRLQERADWPFEPIANIEPQLRIVLRQLTSVTLKEMAVSFPWPTREMGGAEVLPIRSMKPEEKNRWLQQLFTLLGDEKSKGSASRSRSPSSSRFEAPRGVSPLPRSPSPSPNHLEPTLQRSNAARSPSPVRFEQLSLTVPDGNPSPRHQRSSSGDTSLVRLLSVTQRPGRAMLADAMSLALFRVDE
jgi:2-polyprenyl-6-methoxyphenol hydroxylase-like FAD-dependent oxidoreductase